MKRDMELVRHILLELEKKEDSRQPLNSLEVDGYSDEQISHHVEIMTQADLITSYDASSMSGYAWVPINMTWQGHEFLDAARNDTIWNKAKNKMSEESGGWTLDLLKAYLIHEAKRQLGIET